MTDREPIKRKPIPPFPPSSGENASGLSMLMSAYKERSMEEIIEWAEYYNVVVDINEIRAACMTDSEYTSTLSLSSEGWRHTPATKPVTKENVMDVMVDAAEKLNRPEKPLPEFVPIPEGWRME